MTVGERSIYNTADYSLLAHSRSYSNYARLPGICQALEHTLGFLYLKLKTTLQAML